MIMKKFYWMIAFILQINTFCNAYNEYLPGTTRYISPGSKISESEKKLITKIKTYGNKIESNHSDLRFMIQLLSLRELSEEVIKNLHNFSDAIPTNIWIYHEPVTFLRFTVYYTTYILEETSDGQEKILQKTFYFFKE
jgi:hypothetical protein